MGMDSNYATFLSDMLNPHMWPNTHFMCQPSRTVGTQPAWWTSLWRKTPATQLPPTLDCKQVWLMRISWPDLVSHGLCRSYSWLDKLFTQSIITEGTTVEVLDCLPIYMDHHPVFGHFPALSLWRTKEAQAPATRMHL